MRSLLLLIVAVRRLQRGERGVHLCGGCVYVYTLVLVRKYSRFSNSRISAKAGASS